MRNLVTRRNDFLFPIESHFNKVFDQLLDPKFDLNSLKDSLKASQGYPKMDVFETERKLVMKVGVPGIQKEEISVEYNTEENGRPSITISGKCQKYNETKEDVNYYVRELRQSVFERTVLLPEYAKKEPDAVLKDGVLTLTWDVPQTKVPEPKKITIK